MKVPAPAHVRRRQRGVTLVVIAFLLVGLLGAAALAIDLGMLYVARSQAQRAADAAALAGASVFSGTCVTAGTCESTVTESQAVQNAVAAAGANDVLGQPGTICCDTTSSPGASCSASTGTNCSGIQFTDPTTTGTEPQITVKVQRLAIPLIFAKALGDSVANVSAVATAEAYNTGVQECVSPFLVPNCDPNTADYGITSPSILSNAQNGVCTGGSFAPFVNVTSASGVTPVTSVIVNSGTYAGGTGVLGEPWTLHTYYNEGTPVGADGSVTPSQWSMASFSGNNGASDLANFIASCTPVGCGSVVGTVPGDKPVTIDSAVNQLINHTTCSGNGNYCGQTGLQDTLDNMTGSPAYPGPYSSPQNCVAEQAFPFSYGTWPNSPGGNGCAIFGQSSSIITAPIFGGNALPHGTTQVVVVGFVELFLDYSTFSQSQETVQANVLNVQACGGNNTTGPASGTFIPIRLIQGPN